jgi:hypothetical protein
MVAREPHIVGLFAFFDVYQELIVALSFEVRHNAAKFVVWPLLNIMSIYYQTIFRLKYIKELVTWLVFSRFVGLYVVIPCVPTENIRLYLLK